MDRSNPVPIAIIGYGYRLPGGINNDDEFWKLISERGFVQEPIEDRYGKGQCPHDGFDSPMRVASPYEGLIKDGEELHFDCALFGMSPNDAKRMDPQCKMMLSCTWEALEMAGLDQASLHNSNTGVFCGVQVSSCAGWRPPFGATPADVPGKSLSMISNRISFHFNWMGPSFSVATACSSGITALDAATGKLKWYDHERGFGFITSDDGEDVFVHTNALPVGVVVKPGMKMEFGVADGRRGRQALNVSILDPIPSLVEGQRKPADDMAVIIEDLIKLLDSVHNGLRRGRFPEGNHGTKIASLLRAVANDLDS
jgi:CspA family cold shock protein